MKHISLIALAIVFFTVLACNDHHDHLHWDYTGELSPEHWAEVEEYSDCNGKHQSPINIIDIDAKTLGGMQKQLKLGYDASTHIYDVVNNGHTIQFDFEKGDSLIWKDVTYYLKQIHFHEPAEHMINGIRYPIEIHLVHQNNAGELAVVGILGKEGVESPAFEFLEHFLPLPPGTKAEIDKAFDLNTIIPDDRAFYTYSGSLTTPPCSEGVRWFVMRDAIDLSEEQVLVLQENMPHNNYRGHQPLNYRVVKKSF
jgi:carbonic anhydrase